MTTNTVTENTPVTVTLPLGLARTVVVALASYAEEANESRLEDETGGKHDTRILQLIAGANNLVREAAAGVDPDFNRGAAMAWTRVAPEANRFLRGLNESGQLTPEAVAAALASVDADFEAANAARAAIFG